MKSLIKNFNEGSFDNTIENISKVLDDKKSITESIVFTGNFAEIIKERFQVEQVADNFEK